MVRPRYVVIPIDEDAPLVLNTERLIGWRWFAGTGSLLLMFESRDVVAEVPMGQVQTVDTMLRDALGIAWTARSCDGE